MADEAPPPTGPPPDSNTATAEAAGLEDDIGPTCVEVDLHGARRRIDVAAGDVVVGRSSQATLSIEDERISRRHLQLTAREGALYATDLGSRNGTLLNGRRLEGERRLRGGDLLEAGSLRVRVGGVRRQAALLPEGELMDRLDEEVERARSFQRPLSAVGLRLQGAPQAVDDATGRLLGRLGRLDAVGEYAAGRLLVLLPERSLAAAEATAAALRELAAGVPGVEVGAAAATLPPVGGSADELLAVALREARGGASAPPPSGPVVADPATRAVYETARRVARAMASVLIIGESGAGKEWVAAEIHAAGPRGAGPLVRLNCAALPETLIESELFGHEKGAFTGAERRRVGRIEAAHGGTLFLDEIGELPLPLQAKLLHVIEDRRVVRLGSNEPVAVDVRFVAATNRDLEAEVKAKRFREDLYYRLSAVTLQVPPLRERPGDLIPLAEHFLAEASRGAGRRPPRMDEGFRAGLQSYPWPGNVRELKNVIDRAVALGDGDALTRRELPERLRAVDVQTLPAGPMRQRMDDVERRSLEQALDECGGNRTHAARKLGISRRALIYKLHKFGLIKDRDE